MTIGQQIRAAREWLGETQSDVHAGTGLSIVHLSNLENDKENPTLDTLQRIADHFGLKLEVALHMPSVDEQKSTNPTELEQLRQRAAVAAMAALINGDLDLNPEYVAKKAWRCADALVKERYKEVSEQV